jgi:hypothetical protein
MSFVCFAFISFASASFMLPDPVLCALSCGPVKPMELRYCAGIVNYATCLSQKEPNATLADESAWRQSLTLPRFSESVACGESMRDLLCSLHFPKCSVKQVGLKAVTFSKSLTVSLLGFFDTR